MLNGRGWEGSWGELMTVLGLTSSSSSPNTENNLMLNHYTTQMAQVTALDAMILLQGSHGEAVGSSFQDSLS